MPHYFDSGFVVREPAWHGLAKVLQTAPKDWTEARALAGLGWNPVTSEIYYKDAEEFHVLQEYQTIRRDDTNEILAVQKASYAVIGNDELGDVIEFCLGEWDFSYATAGATHNGRQVFVALTDGKQEQVGRDPSKVVKYWVVLSRNDGNGGLKVFKTLVRPVCANTIKAGELDAQMSGISFTIRHTANWASRLSEIRVAVNEAKLAGRRAIARLADLSYDKVTEGERDRFLEVVFPIVDEQTERTKEHQKLARHQVIQNLRSQTCEGIWDTKLGLFHATVEWADHFRKARSADTRTSRTLLDNDPFKTEVWKVLTSA
jgi:phage/plasmid-like protein (TIGR03299 family)